MKKVISLFFTLIFLAAATGSAFGCLCIGPDNAKEAKGWAGAVFTGEIIAFEREGDNGLYTFKVERVWKGVSEEKIVLVDQMYQSSCDSGLKLGQRYIIFASYESFNPRTEKIEYLSLDKDGKPRPVIDVCSWSTNLANPEVNKKILRKIGKGRPVTAKK